MTNIPLLICQPNHFHYLPIDVHTSIRHTVVKHSSRPSSSSFLLIFLSPICYGHKLIHSISPDEVSTQGWVHFMSGRIPKPLHTIYTHKTHIFASTSVHRYLSNPLLSLPSVCEFMCLCMFLCAHVYVCVLWKAAGFVCCLCVMWRKQRQPSRGPSLCCNWTVNTVPLQRENLHRLPACVNPNAFTN